MPRFLSRSPSPSLSLIRSLRSSTLLAAAALAACASLPTRARLGDVTVRSRADAQVPAVTLGVQTGRILSGDLDLVIDPDGCLRGNVGSRMVMLCPKSIAADAGLAPGARREQWSGASGSITLEVDPEQKSVRADGFLRGVGRRTNGTEVAATLPFGHGPEWDELRAHPALYAVAASVSGARGDALLVVQDPPADAGTPADTEAPRVDPSL